MLSTIDWAVVTLYPRSGGGKCVPISATAIRRGLLRCFQQGNALSIALSVMATQCSTNSILGAPAFVAFVVGGGLVWLQYELALPLAMIFIAVFLIPFSIDSAWSRCVSLSRSTF